MAHKITYTNEKGQSITMGDSAPLVITQIDGLGSVQNDIQRQKAPGQDGSTITGSTLTERGLTFTGIILSIDQEKYRRELLHVFNPKLSGTIKYEKGAVNKQIDCRVEIAPDFPSGYKGIYQTFIINLLCANPFWLDIEESQIELVSWIGGMTFPLSMPTTFSMAGESRINVINRGDVETPIRIEITGPATNPKLINALTGEYIRVKQSLLSGDIMTITTDFGRKRVEINGQNAFNYIDLTSTFFNLNPGDNILELTTEDINDDARVEVSYRNRYLGV